jgi:crotonobetainyl-CoA:carnitine CoA-transferase CaiB-like acyl-CoA transferase
MCGRLLADMGACVLKIEPIKGVNSRKLAPFDSGDGESLYWAHVGAGKYSISINFEDSTALEKLKNLIKRADIFVESSDLNYMNQLGFSYDSLCETNERLIYVSISAYGRTGPKASWPATDFTVESAAGLTTLQGDGDRPPVAVGYPQASFHAGAQAATDAVIALNERASSGKGQHLDVSMQTTMIWTLMHATGFWPMEQCEPPLTGDDRADEHEFIGKLELGLVNTIECLDGFVLATLRMGRFGARVFRMAAALAELDDDLDPELRNVDWDEFSLQLLPAGAGDFERADASEETSELISKAADMVYRVFGRRTKAEIFDRAVTYDAQVAPVNSIADLVDRDPQLRSRGFWKKVGDRIHPDTPVKFSRTLSQLSYPAPNLGVHNEVLAGPIVFPSGLPARNALANGLKPMVRDREGLAFSGLKVADFSWVGVGPITAKALADHGATVVHIESASMPDVLRMGRPAKDGIPGLDRGQFFANFNSSKLGLQLNLRTAYGKKIARDLIDWADVVVDSFTSGTMKRLGFDPKDILKSRPDLIWYSTTLRGQTGPHASFGGFGSQGSAIAGLHGLTGWPDRAPAGTWGAYTDFITPRYGVSALAAAIFERRATGLGQFIDMSQTEAGLQFIGPLLLDYTTNGNMTERSGNSSHYACPNGIYPTSDGTERYIAISCETEEQWARLVALIDSDFNMNDFGLADFSSREKRLKHEDTINQIITDWSNKLNGRELELRLIGAGIPASVVQRTSELYSDDQLEHRGFFETLNHALMGPTPYDGHSTIFSARKGNSLRGPGPVMGEHTHQVLTEILKLDELEIAEAAVSGAFE